MLPVPIDLPIRPSEAALLAELIFDQIAGRPLTDDIRNRVAGRATAAGFVSLRPYPGSLEADPVHTAAYFLAVDGLTEAASAPLLLHIAPATAPASALFPQPLLIGRMRPAGGRELIINATPFGPDDHHSIQVFARELNRAFLPRPHGVQSALRAAIETPRTLAPAAFQAFRTIAKTTGRNLAALEIPASASLFWETVWAAIRAGFRDGYTLGGNFTPAVAPLFSYFTLPLDNALSFAREIRSHRSGTAWDLEVDLALTPAGEIHATLDALKAAACPAYTVQLDSAHPELAAACAAIVAAGAIPVFRGGVPSDAFAASLRNATHGRFVYSTPFCHPGAAGLLDLLDVLR